MLARRLNNSEYNYSIRDLAGQDIRPAREFPVDPANQAGFDNSGESLDMSPALMSKYHDLNFKYPGIKTFDRHVLPYEIQIQPGFGGGMGSPSLAADQSHPGGFAIMILAAGNSEMRVYLPDDYGKSWKGPILAGRVPGATMTKPDMAYSPRGE